MVSYAEHKVAPSAAEKAGREWAEQWLGDLRKRFAKPHEPVMHRANRGVRSFKPRMDFPFLNTPPITGPLSFALALSTGFPLPTNSTEFYPWLEFSASPIQKERHKKIMADLRNYFQTRGYSQDQSFKLARDLFDNKKTIYYPLVVKGAPNLALLTAGQSRNPYARSSVVTEATDYYNLGLMCQKVGNHQEAFEMYKHATRTGHAMAQASLAYLYETGQGVSRDLDKAMEYYQLAAKQGHAVAQYNLGRIYQNGLTHGLQVIRPDAQKAEQFLQRAAAQGIVAAYHQLGVLYYTLGMQINPTELKPEEFAQWDKNKDKNISLDENRLLQDAHDHFLLAAKQDHGPAQHALGVMYLQGHGVASKPETSVHWLEKAVTHKLPDSLYNLALHFENGTGVRPNLTRAFTLYRQAARLGHAPSQYNLGLFYYQGRNAGTLLSVPVPKDFHDKHPAKTLPGELVQLDPEENAILAYAVALYRPRYGSENWDLELLLPVGQGEFAKAVLNEFARKKSLGKLPEPKVEQLGGDDLTRAYVWWKLAADRRQQAAITGRELLKRILTPDQLKVAETQAAIEKSRIVAPKAPNPMVQAQAKIPFQATDWSTGFFVSEDGYVITGKHLIRGGTRFQVVTENGTFPARALNLPGDLDQFLLLKVDGGYKFPALTFSASHSTRQRDPVQVLGYQLPENIEGTLPRAAQANTRIYSVLGAQADPRFFTLQQPVLGDQLVLKFKKYLDDRSMPVVTMVNDETGNPISSKPIEETLSPSDLRELQVETLNRLKGTLRAHHILLGNAHVSLGYQLKNSLWYDAVGRVWLKDNKTQARAHHFTAGRWVELDGRRVHVAPPLDKVREGQAMIRISVVPGIVLRDSQNLPTDVQAALKVAANKRSAAQRQTVRRHSVRLYQLAEDVLTKATPGYRPKTTLENIIKDAQFEVVSKTPDSDFTPDFTPGFRGTALLNHHGQAIGLFFPSFRGRTPDVFQNFSSYHRYLLKSDHLMAFLNRLPDVNYTTRQRELPKMASNEGEATKKAARDAYLLAKAKASMVLVQVAGELPVSPPKADGGNQP
jgi:TPR repeat protein